jgi:hypothetical protein
MSINEVLKRLHHIEMNLENLLDANDMDSKAGNIIFTNVYALRALRGQMQGGK